MTALQRFWTACREGALDRQSAKPVTLSVSVPDKSRHVLEVGCQRTTRAFYDFVHFCMNSRRLLHLRINKGKDARNLVGDMVEQNSHRFQE